MVHLILRILKISLIVCIAVILINVLFFDVRIAQLANLKTLGIFFFYSVVISMVNAIFFNYFNKKVGWDKNLLKSIIMASAGSIVLTMAAYFFCRAVHHVIFTNTYTFTQFLEKENLSNYLFPLLFALIVMLFFYLIYFYKALQEQKIKEQKIIAGTANAQFDALKNQLDPHFLFNSLNVLAALIDEEPEKAQKFTSSLSKVYRYVLEQKNKDLVTVAEELQFAKIYMDLLKMRFEDAIIFNFPEELLESDAKVVPLSLQLLLENTVKHNKVMESSPLKISIYESQKMLIVKNNLQHKEILNNSSGVGLFNIKERYKLLTKRKVEIIKSKEEFMVLLPLLTKQTETIIMENNTSMHESDSYKRAKVQVEKEKGFYGNLTSYCIIIPILVVFNFLTTSFPWSIFPALGWGLGLLFHGFAAFSYNPFFGKDWETRKIREIMNKNE
ncbi:MAG TPA: histidine kinase [Leeuwenhoekiella sp.]|nr:histidine kinase [Leeuwenhoekiella sp.]